MANKILSIEIGQNLTKVVEMDYKSKKPKIYNCFMFETPTGMVDDGSVNVNPLFTAAFKQECGLRDINTTKVIFTIISSRIANREVTIPLIKENRIGELIMTNASEYFPVDVTQYKLIHSIIEKIDTPELKQYKLSILAVPRELLVSYRKLAEDCGLSLEAYDYTGNSVFQVAKRYYKEGTNVLFKVESVSSLITIVKNGTITLQRTIPYGIGDAVETLIESKVFGEVDSYIDAMGILTRKTCIRKYLNVAADYKEEEDTSDEIRKARSNITEALRPIVSNFGRILDYYMSTHAEEKYEKINLIGTGADFSGLSKLLTNELNTKVTVLTRLDEANLTKNAQEEAFSISHYIACIGATMAPVLTAESLIDKSAKKKGNDSIVVPVLVCGICVVLAVGMVAYSLATSLALTTKKADVENEIAKLAPAQEIYNTYMDTNAEYKELETMYGMTKTPNDELLAFIQELELKMPSNINVLVLSADTTTVNMNLNVVSKEEAAQVLVQLRNFESLATVDTTGITDTKDETGAGSVSMSVSCTYKLATASTQDTQATQQ